MLDAAAHATTDITLRPYQLTCVSRVLEAFQLRPKGGRVLIVLPTGCGKTLVFAKVAHHMNLTTLIIAHRQELLQQAADKYRMIDPTAIIGQVGAGRHEWGAPVTVASVQTISRPEHLKKLKLFGYGLVIIDECHHSASAGYQAVLGALPEACVLGVTATPDRLDKLSIEQIFGEPVFQASIIDMVEQGYLSNIRAIAIPTATSLDDLHTQAGDFKVDELEVAVDTPDRNGRIVSAYRTHCNGRQGLCFAVTVAHAEHLTEAFKHAGIPAASVCGETPQEERKRILAEYDSGELHVLCNVGVLTEGYDHPKTSCILMARPTQSRALYVQCLDASTEILTPDGWKSYQDIKVGSLVAGYDKDTEAIQWVPALSKVERPLAPEEQMFELRAPTLDLRISGGHRMVYRTRYGRKRIRTKWDFIEAQELYQRELEYEIPVAGMQQSSGAPLSDDELRFIGWFLTDGTLNRKNEAITIYQAAHQPHHEAIRSCIEGCGFKYSMRAETSQSQYKATSQRIRYIISKGQPRGTDKHLTGWGKLEPYIDKNFSPLLDNITSEQLEIMLEAIHLGDGLKQCGQSWTRRSYHIITGNKIFAERLQSLCVRRGFKCNLSPHKKVYYALHIKKVSTRYVGGKNAMDRPHMEESPSHSGETIWCVENTFGTIVTRRNGKVAIVGNCIGRGTRLAPGKADCIILDITDNTLKHRLEPLSLSRALARPLRDGESILEAKEREEREEEEQASEKITGQGEERERRTKVTKREQDLEIHLLDRMEWQRKPNGVYHLEVGEQKHRLLLFPSETTTGHYSVWARLAPDFRAQQWLKDGPLDDAMQHAEMKARLLQSEKKQLVDAGMPWRSGPVTDGQRFMLIKFGIDYTDFMTSGEASDLIGKAIVERDRLKALKKAEQAANKAAKQSKKRGRASA